MASFTEERRARLRKAVDRIERLETRNTITEPISITALSVTALSGLARLGLAQVHGGSDRLGVLEAARQAALNRGSKTAAPAILPLPQTSTFLATAVGTEMNQAAAGTGRAAYEPEAPAGESAGRPASVSASGSSGDWLSLEPASPTATETGISAPWHPARPTGGGAAMAPRGAPPVARGTVQPMRVPAPAQNAGATNAAASAAASGALLSALGSSGTGASARGPSGAAAAPAVTRNDPAQALGAGPAPAGGATSAGTGTNASPTGPTGPAGSFGPLVSPPFELVTLDYNDGSVMVPGFDQLATPGGSVDLRAQVRDSATGTYTFSWNTSGLTDATSISGTGTYDLTFQWDTSVATANAESVTLSVTDPNNSVVSQTYDFWVPAGTGSATGGTTWNNTTLDPGLIQGCAPTFASDNVLVVAPTGALETAINLPSYNPNVPAISLVYNSLAANAMPVVVAEHQLDPTQAAPSQVSAQLTFDGTAGSTRYYSTSSFIPGDIMQIGQQANASTLSTGRYSYTETIIDYRSGIPTTFTYSGTATVENAAEDPTFAALGAGWTVDGLEKIISASGGVIVDEGGGTVEWFSGSFGSGGGTFTSPAGDFSTLTQNSGGGYTQTFTDGTKLNFNSGGFETTSVDRNGLTTTYTYTGNLLTSITDPFSQIVTFTYNGSNQLQSIKDPASRLTTFTVSGGDLTAVEYPDGNSWDYAYNGSNQMTSVTEPSSAGEPAKIATITYDSANRVGTVTQANSTTETFSAAQEQGWTNSGTSGSPAAATLLAEVGSTFTDALSEVTTLRPDWRGMGLTDQSVDALSNVSTYDRDANGLATIAIDPMDRITQYAHDSKGNVTKITYPDLSTVTYGTYNSFAEPASMTNQLGGITTYTYDSHGNMTVEEDPMTYVATYTYSNTQPGMLTAQTAPALVGHSSYTLWSYQYDSYDRLTTITNADSDVTVKAYSSAGQVTSVTDPNSNETTYTLDAMNRETGMTTAAGSAIAGTTTYGYDAAGNQTTETDPTGYTITTTYDAMDRTATVENADGAVTTYSYDNAGRLHVLTDPNANPTTFTYNALGEETEVTSPSVNASGGVSATFVYDADGELTDTTDADGRRTTYSFDSLGDQTGETWLNSSGGAIYTATYTYNSAREMTGAADNYATLTMAYDSDGRLGTLVTSGPGTGQPTVTLTYSYDPSGDITGITDSLSGSGAAGQGVTSYAYDSALQLTTVTQSLGGTTYGEITMSYDSGGRLTKEYRSEDATGTIVITKDSYDAANDITGMSSTTGTEGSPLIHTTIVVDSPTYNSAGELTQYAQTYSGHNVSNTYSYDHAGQLTGASGTVNDSYSYDSGGNQNSSGFTTGAGNEMTASSGYTYTYDNDGNMISSTNTSTSVTTTYTYDDRNRLTNVEVGGTMVATYTYNVLNQRIGIDDSGTQTWTVFNGKSATANPYADFNGSGGGLKMRYLDGLAVDELFARTDSSGNLAWYLTDQLGSVTDVVNSSGTDIDHIIYDPYGNIVTETNATNGDRFKFTGMEYDSVAGAIYYDHARYYDAAIGRFVSQDPKGFAAGDANLFRYVGNCPTNDTDPSGLQFGRGGDNFVDPPAPLRPRSGPVDKVPFDFAQIPPYPAPTPPTTTGGRTPIYRGGDWYLKSPSLGWLKWGVPDPGHPGYPFEGPPDWTWSGKTWQWLLSPNPPPPRDRILGPKGVAFTQLFNWLFGTR
jgi:RHS repeat-associated protein